jgi:choline dehydrogenase-like flavoprotein
MLEDFNTCTHDTRVETEICIIGAGAAGITLARQLMSAGVAVCVLESGGTDYEHAVQDMASGASVGYPYYSLVDSRLRFFGGTTSIWGGRVAQLDRIDFDRRDWIARSGWPFAKTVLEPFYARAQGQLDVAEIFGSDNMASQLGHDSEPFDSRLLRAAFWQFDEQSERFTLRRCSDLVNAPNVKVLLHATVVNIRASAEGTAIEEVRIANLRGGRGTIVAKAFVLAAGGLENPRLLLAANDVHKNGLGNTHDQVGRYFMEHPRARGAHVRSHNIGQLLDMFPRLRRIGGHRYAALLRGSEALQAREGILNTSVSLSVRQHVDDRLVLHKRVYRSLKERLPPNRLGRSLWLLVRQGSVRAREHLEPLLRWNSVQRYHDNVYVVVRAEQAPNPDSRVTLTGETDALGVPRLALDWRFSDIDKRTVTSLMSVFDQELRRCKLGCLEASPWLADDGPAWETDPLISNHPIGGYHHLGTTRMAASPRNGVVDADCRVHGVKNLYIAGSSVFPTGGWANPTLTILALALRLADQLEKVIRRPTSGASTADPSRAMDVRAFNLAASKISASHEAGSTRT